MPASFYFVTERSLNGSRILCQWSNGDETILQRLVLNKEISNRKAITLVNKQQWLHFNKLLYRDEIMCLSYKY